MLDATRMACSCRTSALQIFVRSLAQVHAPTTQHVRSAWLETRPRLPSRNISIASNYRQEHTTSGSSDVVTGEARERTVRAEDQHKPQPERDPPSSSLQSRRTESLSEDDKLFSIKPKSKNAKRKAARYPKQVPGSQEQANEGLGKAEQELDVTAEKAQKKKDKKAKRQRERADERARSQQPERQTAKTKDREPRVDERPEWSKQKEALKQKFPEGWRPPKRLSPDALEGIRVLHKQFPDMYTTEALAEKFEVSPEAIRRILRAKWEPTAEEEEERQRRWFNRGVSVWQRYAELGMQPPRRWREAGVEASPWQGATRTPRKEDYREEEGEADKVDPETATRLQAQAKLSKSLV